MKQRKNKYYRRSHISEAKFRHLLKCFAMDLNAYEAFQLTGISHRSYKIIYAKLRLHIAQQNLEILSHQVSLNWMSPISVLKECEVNVVVARLERRLSLGCSNMMAMCM